jgi:hypothetical protein
MVRYRRQPHGESRDLGDPAGSRVTLLHLCPQRVGLAVVHHEVAPVELAGGAESSTLPPARRSKTVPVVQIGRKVAATGPKGTLFASTGVGLSETS